MSRLGAAAAVLLGCLGCAADRPEDAAVPASSSAMVLIGEIPTVTLRAGGSGTVTVPVIVGEGYHVQSNPAAQEFLVPLELRIEEVDGLELGEPGYPPGRAHRLKGADQDLTTYEGTVEITVSVVAPSAASPGGRTIRGSLRYQACDAGRCYVPASLPVEFTVVVSG